MNIKILAAKIIYNTYRYSFRVMLYSIPFLILSLIIKAAYESYKELGAMFFPYFSFFVILLLSAFVIGDLMDKVVLWSFKTLGKK